MGTTVVRRTTGFGQHFAFRAETTVATENGPVTATEFGHTEAGAAARSQYAARDRTMFAGFKRAAGFAKNSFYRTANTPAGTTGFSKSPAFWTPNKPANFSFGFA